jgi:hypothetical protein
MQMTEVNIMWGARVDLYCHDTWLLLPWFNYFFSFCYKSISHSCEFPSYGHTWKFSSDTDLIIVHRSTMVDLQGLICWDDIATAFQISHQPTTRSTYGSAQITRMLAVGLLLPGTLQTQVWCLFIWQLYHWSLMISFINNYTFRQSLHILNVKWTVFIGVLVHFICSFISLSSIKSIVVCLYEYLCLYAHVCWDSCINIDHYFWNWPLYTWNISTL